MTTPDTAKRVAMACLVGTAIEWYDFFIYGTASALILPKLFFPSLDRRPGRCCRILRLHSRSSYGPSAA